MNNKEKCEKLENAGFNWLEIAEIIDISYEEVRNYQEEE